MWKYKTRAFIIKLCVEKSMKVVAFVDELAVGYWRHVIELIKYLFYKLIFFYNADVRQSTGSLTIRDVIIFSIFIFLFSFSVDETDVKRRDKNIKK